MSNIEVKTTKGFNVGGTYIKRGSTIPVSEIRAGELLRNGLIEKYDVKNASSHENKKAPEPANKAAPASKSKTAEKPKAE